MLEFLIIAMAAMPFLVGMIAIKKMKRRKDMGSDDQPPPPDPNPPLPVLPPSPEVRRSRKAFHREPNRGAQRHARVPLPAWTPRVRC